MEKSRAGAPRSEPLNRNYRINSDSRRIQIESPTRFVAAESMEAKEAWIGKIGVSDTRC
jgi:hypothetical protein